MVALMSTLKGVVAAVWIALNTLALGPAVLALAVVRALAPGARARAGVGAFMDGFIDRWVRHNRVLFGVLRITNVNANWHGTMPARDSWYLVIANHQAWSDILVLQHLLLDRVPPLKFFVKRVLFWIPIVGASMWVLGFPFLRRYGADQLARDPRLGDADRRAAAAACDRFRRYPTSVLIFVEGSRFTESKRTLQMSPYRHLLTPKVGGVGYVLDGVGDRIDRVIDVTLLYPGGVPTFWEFLCGRCPQVEAEVKCLAAPAPEGSVTRCLDAAGRAELKAWIGDLWMAKDNLMSDRLAN
jgi:1-acyl-sn-glycerol-3-phosphate acyltransferase